LNTARALSGEEMTLDRAEVGWKCWVNSVEKVHSSVDNGAISFYF
jgi:hypothetical protein